MNAKNILRKELLLPLLVFISHQAIAQNQMSEDNINNPRNETTQVFNPNSFSDTLNGEMMSTKDSRNEIESFVQSLQYEKLTLERLQSHIKNLIQKLEEKHITKIIEKEDRLKIFINKEGKYIVKWFDLDVNHGFKIITSPEGEIKKVRLDYETINFDELTDDFKIYIEKFIKELELKIENQY